MRLPRRLLGILPLLLVALFAVTRHGGTSGSDDPGAAPTSAGKPPSGCHLRGKGLYVSPDPRCSPGARNPAVTQGNLDDTICRSGYSKSIRPPESVTEPEKLVVMRAYGLRGSPHPYELDHIISLELGGAANSYKNYYPELNYPHPSGFFLNPKDHVEGALHRLICDRRISLARAQRLIATDWVGALRKYG